MLLEVGFLVSAYIGKRRLDKRRHKNQMLQYDSQKEHKKQLINNPEKLNHTTEIPEKTDKALDYQLKVSFLGGVIH